jgi:hypothetical protein
MLIVSCKPLMRCSKMKQHLRAMLAGAAVTNAAEAAVSFA